MFRVVSFRESTRGRRGIGNARPAGLEHPLKTPGVKQRTYTAGNSKRNLIKVLLVHEPHLVSPPRWKYEVCRVECEND